MALLQTNSQEGQLGGTWESSKAWLYMAVHKEEDTNELFSLCQGKII